MVSIVVAVAGVVSCLADIKQAKLTELEIQNKNREKQPFFSIHQEYIQERKQYIYRVYNTGGEVRYSNLQIMPILFITQYAEDGSVKNKASIDLPGLYQYEILDASDSNELISFSDKWVDTTLICDNPISVNKSTTILLNDYLMHICAKNNSVEKEEYVTSSLGYWINVSYYNFQNIEMHENIWCGRSSDLSGRTEGNNVLFIQPSLAEWYKEGREIKKRFYVDSMNLTLEESLKECEECIDELIEEWE